VPLYHFSSFERMFPRTGNVIIADLIPAMGERAFSTPYLQLLRPIFPVAGSGHFVRSAVRRVCHERPQSCLKLRCERSNEKKGYSLPLAVFALLPTHRLRDGNLHTSLPYRHACLVHASCLLDYRPSLICGSKGMRCCGHKRYGAVEVAERCTSVGLPPETWTYAAIWCTCSSSTAAAKFARFRIRNGSHAGHDAT